jgi:hypothetical protein
MGMTHSSRYDSCGMTHSSPEMGGLEYPSPYATAGLKRRPKGAMAKGAEVLAAPKNDTGHSSWLKTSKLAEGNRRTEPVTTWYRSCRREACQWRGTWRGRPKRFLPIQLCDLGNIPWSLTDRNLMRPISDSYQVKPALKTWGAGGVETISYYRTRTWLGGRTSWGTGSVVLGECSFLIPHLRMGCREETWVMVNTFKVDQARGTV